MVTNNKVKVAVFAAFITVIHFSGNVKGDEKSKNYNRDIKESKRFEYCYVPVRLTTYHKSESGCDPDTKREKSSTGIKLREGKLKVVGTIAADKNVIPIGSLVLVTTKSGSVYPYLCVDTGSAVVNRKASRQLARQEGRSKEWATRPVVDIYSSREIAPDWSTVIVIKDRSTNGVQGPDRLKRLQERMSVDYWSLKGLETLNEKNQLLAYNK